MDDLTAYASIKRLTLNDDNTVTANVIIELERGLIDDLRDLKQRGQFKMVLTPFQKRLGEAAMAEVRAFAEAHPYVKIEVPPGCLHDPVMRAFVYRDVGGILAGWEVCGECAQVLGRCQHPAGADDMGECRTCGEPIAPETDATEVDQEALAEDERLNGLPPPFEGPRLPDDALQPEPEPPAAPPGFAGDPPPTEKGEDPMMAEAVKLWEANPEITGSKLQRDLKIGYPRAMRMMAEIQARAKSADELRDQVNAEAETLRESAAADAMAEGAQQAANEAQDLEPDPDAAIRARAAELEAKFSPEMADRLARDEMADGSGINLAPGGDHVSARERRREQSRNSSSAI